MTTLQELLARKAELDRKIEEATTHGRAEALAKIKALMEEVGLTAADLGAASSSTRKRPGPGDGPKRSGPTVGSKVAAKYRDSKSGQTWSGRGLQPKWLKEAIAGGKSKEDFAV